MFKIPVSGFLNIKDNNNIKDCELKFLGWFLSDGSSNKYKIDIAQSENKKDYLIDIRTTLIECGYKYNEYVSYRKGEFKKYANLIHFNISSKQYNNILQWVDKKIPKIYNSLSRRQLIILLNTYFKGDGRKRHNASWNSQTMNITCGNNENMADRFQELCITRGLACNKGIYKTKTGFTCELMIKDITYRTIAGINVKNNIIKTKKIKRSILKKSNSTPRNWCVENDIGTIIIRKKGRVSIVGNCGRALRRSPGKLHAIIIDQAGNIFDHGHPLKIRKWGLDGKIKEDNEDEIKIKQCPSCNAWIMKGVSICPYCNEDLSKIKPEKPKEIKILNAPLVEIKLPEIMTGRVAVDLADVMECQEEQIDNEIIERIKQIRESKDDMRLKLELISKYFNKSHKWTEHVWDNFINK